MSKSERRQKTKIVPVRATPEEKEALQKKAEAFGISCAELCRRLVFGSRPPKSKLDQQAIEELRLLRADLGRIGGLLKGWLGGSFMDGAGLPMDHEADQARKLLAEIEQKQALITEKVLQAFSAVAGEKSDDSQTH